MFNEQITLKKEEEMSRNSGIVINAMSPVAIDMMRAAASTINVKPTQMGPNGIGGLYKEPTTIYLGPTDIISIDDSDGSPLSQHEDEMIGVIPNLAAVTTTALIVPAPEAESASAAVANLVAMPNIAYSIVEQQQSQEQQQQEHQHHEPVTEFIAVFNPTAESISSSTPYDGPDIEVSNATDVGFVLTIYGYRVYVALEKIVSMDEDCDAVFTADEGQILSIPYSTMKHAIRLYSIARDHVLLRYHATTVSVGAEAAEDDNAPDLIAVAMSDSELYPTATDADGIDEELFPYPLPVLPAPPVSNVTCETHVLLNQSPIMSTIETASNISDAEKAELLDATENIDLEQSLAVIGINKQPTNIIPMLDLPITVTNPDIATRALNQMDVFDVNYVTEGGDNIDDDDNADDGVCGDHDNIAVVE